MALASRGRGFNADEARQQQRQIREQFRNLEQARTQLEQALNEDQRAALLQQTQNMEHLFNRIEARLGDMEMELSSPAPNAKGFAEQARLTEREMNSYRNHFRQVGDDWV